MSSVADSPALSFDAQTLGELSQLIGLIYEGATALEVWQTVPLAIGQWLAAPRCTLFTPLHPLEQGGFMTAHNLSPLAIELWATKYHQLDLWAQRAVQRGYVRSGDVARDQDLASEEELLSTEMYREFFAPMNVGRVLTGIVFGADAPGQMPVACSANRPLREPFTAEEAFRLRLVLPHLSRAMGVMFRLREADFKLASSHAALDQLAQAVVLFGAQGQVSHANRAALQVCDTNDGLSVGAGGRLRSARGWQQAALDAALSAALHTDVLEAAHFCTTLAVERPSGLPAYVLRFSPLPARNEFARGVGTLAAIAFIDDGSTHWQPDPEVFRARYGLSSAELRVAEQASQGLPVMAIAQALAVSTNTVKTHLKRIYSKTGATSRSQLTKLVLAARSGTLP